jgi:hypothetical protein
VAVSLNGKNLDDDFNTGDYVTLDRAWKDGDILEIRLPMGIRVEATPDDSRRVSLFYGPILLAADLGPEGRPSAPVPVLVEGVRPLERSVRPSVAEGPLRFRTAGAGRPDDVALVPYYKSHHAYSPVYFERLSEAEWNRREAERRNIVDRTVDHLSAGDDASGKAHDLDTANAPLAMPMGRPAWEIRNEAYAYVSFELDPGGATGPMEIRLSIWSGSEGGFEMTVNGVRVAQAEVKKERHLRVKEYSYAIPDEMIRGSGRLKVWITPKSRMSGPEVFGAALLRRG